ncbi:unnamed protein product [Bathycoccus prasinos]
MFSLSTSLLVPVARPTTTTVSLRKNTNTKVNSTKVALKTAQLQRRKQRVDKRGVHIIAMAGKPERGSRPSAEVIAANPNASSTGNFGCVKGAGTCTTARKARGRKRRGVLRAVNDDLR